jgi:hypothetical protein
VCQWVVWLGFARCLRSPRRPRPRTGRPLSPGGRSLHKLMTSITIYYLIKKLVPGGRMTFDPSIREFLTAARLGVVCTIRPGGRPQQSVTY